jgi:hypothetical protein
MNNPRSLASAAIWPTAFSEVAMRTAPRTGRRAHYFWTSPTRLLTSLANQTLQCDCAVTTG